MEVITTKMEMILSILLGKNCVIWLNFVLIIDNADECLPFYFLTVRWLQPDSYADPQKTSLILNKDDIRCGWPTTITVQTKDQYGEVVHVPNMKVRN